MDTKVVESGVVGETKSNQNEIRKFQLTNSSENNKPDKSIVPTLNPAVDEIIFQQIDIKDYVIKEKSATKEECVIRIFGLTDSGNSVCCTIYGFYPYFYVRILNELEIVDCQKLRNELNTRCSSNRELVIAVENVYRYNIYGYHGHEKLKFLKITVALPSDIKLVKNCFSEDICFETDIDFTLRFMVATGIDGCTWIKLPSESWTFARSQQNNEYASYCQIEVQMNYSKHKFIVYKPEDIWSRIAPLRILSFDIQCAIKSINTLPDVKRDPIVQIANIAFSHSKQEPYLKNIFVLNGCTSINGIDVITFDNERNMLETWSHFVRYLDPDIIVGYDIGSFDIPYLINRASYLNIPNFAYLGRLREIPTTVKLGIFESRQIGRQLNMHINIEGRVLFDLHNIIQKEHQLRSYTFNAVCYHFLGKSKEHLDYNTKSNLYKGNHSTRQRLAQYCLKNVQFTIELLNHLMTIVNYIEMARVTGVTLQTLLRRGQLIRVYSQLLRKAKERDFILQAHYAPSADENFQGGYVLEAKNGFYKEPITLLDFASMYPNIMINFNLCYSTYLQPSMEKRLQLASEDILLSPVDYKFVKPHIRKGLLPEILEYLLAARKRVKEALKVEHDPSKRAILDGRQLAIKLTANAVYGFTGAQHVGKLPCLQVASSVTAFGRQMITKTKQEIESHFSRKNGYENDAQIIYGDTDSVMINFGIKDIDGCISLGYEAAKYISSLFSGTITLEFENIFCPYLLIGKKRYAGLKYTKADKHDGIISRGIETVRRDTPLFVQKLLNTCLKKLFIDQDVDSAIKHAQEVISDLYSNKIDIYELIITKSLANGNEDSKHIQNEVVRKTLKRNPQSSYTVGQRISYVMCASGPFTQFYKKAEDPMYVIENQIPIDCDYYVQKCITKPLLNIFQPILGVQAAALLLRGCRTLSRKANSSRVPGSILKYTVQTPACLSCNRILERSLKKAAVCTLCEPMRSDIYRRELDIQRKLEEKLWRTSVECQRCQGFLIQDVLCSNSECPVLYAKKKAQHELQGQDERLRRFGLPCW